MTEFTDRRARALAMHYMLNLRKCELDFLEEYCELPKVVGVIQSLRTAIKHEL